MWSAPARPNPSTWMAVSFKSASEASSKTDSGPENDSLAEQYATHRALPQSYHRRLFRCPHSPNKVSPSRASS